MTGQTAITQSKQQELHLTVQLEVTQLLARPRISEICETAHRMLLTPKGNYTISFLHFLKCLILVFGSNLIYECSEYGAESVFSGDKRFDEPSWGSFDTHYDADAAWDSNPVLPKVCWYFFGITYHFMFVIFII